MACLSAAGCASSPALTCPLPLRPESVRSDKPSWAAHANDLAKQVAAQPEYIMLGDSITAAWPTEFARRLFEGRPVQAGIGGDTVADVIWRTERLDLSRARKIVLLAGINDVIATQHPPEQTVAELLYEARLLQRTASRAEVVVLAIFPVRQPLDSPERRKIETINTLLQDCLPHGVHLVNVGATLLDKDQLVAPAALPDRVHPTRLTYEILTNAIEAAQRSR